MPDLQVANSRQVVNPDVNVIEVHDPIREVHLILPRDVVIDFARHVHSHATEFRSPGLAADLVLNCVIGIDPGVVALDTTADLKLKRAIIGFKAQAAFEM